MAEIFVCPKGSIGDRSVRALSKAGVVVVQADDPNACRFLRAGQEINSRDMLWAALKAMQIAPAYSDGAGAAKVREEFTKVMFGLVNDARRSGEGVGRGRSKRSV